MALRQARIAAKSRDAEVFLYILERYIENPHLFGVRGFINRHMQEINITVQGPQPTRQNRDIIDQQVRKLSDGKFTLEDIYHVMSSMQNICLLIGHRFMSERLTLEFYAIIRRMWDLLEPMVKFEQERRKADKEYAPWFCDDFERVAIEMRDPGYLARFGIKQSG